MNYSRLKIMNMALDEVPGAQIADPNERSIEAQACRRNFDTVVSELLEEIKPRFARRRVTLAAIANTLPSEWGFAYTAPADLAWPHAVRLPQEANTSQVVMAGQTLVGYPSHYGASLPEIQFTREGSTIWCDIDGAVLDYISDAIDVSAFTPMFAKAVAWCLAERICMTVAKDKVRKRELTTQAEVWRSRAMAAEQNSAPQSWQFTPEVIAARDGIY